MLLAAALIAGASAAAARVDRRSPSYAYIEARAAAAAGALDRASAGYGAVLASAPDNELVAAQALRHAVAAGDWPLALRAVRVLERRNAVAADSRLVLVAAAFKARDWRAAATQIDGVEHDQLFAFTAPILRAWLAQGSGQGDPLAALPAEDAGGLGAAYVTEHRALLMLAAGRPGASDLLVRAAAAAGPREARLRIAGASLLERRGDRVGALALLSGDAAPVVAARAAVQARRPLAGAIAGPEDGMAELLVRLSIDLNEQRLTPLAAMIARLATWLAPDSSETWLVAADLVGAQGRPRVAIPLLANVRADDPFQPFAGDARIRLLLDAGDRDAALAAARVNTSAPGARVADWVRLGEVYSAMSRQAEAADALAHALSVRRDGDGSQPEWTLQLMRGGALDEAGDWPGARTALQQAYRLAPEQPLVLNYLGYGELVRHEQADEAERLIREAHRRAPDNNAITDSLGWALYLRGRLPEAIALLEQAAQGEPADVEINEHLGDAYFAAGRRIEARFAWKAASVYAEGAAATRIAAKLEAGLTPALAAR